ncbi:hypothetical protein D0C16_12965 [Cellvibrio sp. KY-GH-1]|uniref:hypothetical protein n=1 Tax=Cellvibrio sp. KY-GH-1 TaxID=2303332 RepID=UPI00124928B3|nr:hypothetical protein [Cellvibrio sp. KY-GH-1]QEY16801.1 hypothetical protein D0C16_12965 [Cellvibrio sp. KY-GH-1]
MKQHRISNTNNKQEAIAFSQSIGARMSAIEHLVPEQMVSTETEKAQGISAVKALAVASQQGQKIWTITNDNVNLALSRINLGADAENDIRNAVYAGKVATAHETRINFNGWVGEGYTLIDSNTGAGAYMISGGGNGGELISVLGEVVGYLESFLDVMQKVISGKDKQAIAFRALLKVIGEKIKPVAPIVGLIGSILEAIGNCPSALPAVISVIGAAVIALISIGVAAWAATVATGGLGTYIFINVVVPMIVDQISNRLLENLPILEGCKNDD